MSRWAAAAVALAWLALAGCGGSSGDILGLGVSGGPMPARERMHVTEDGRGGCNAGKLRALQSSLLLDARSLVRDAKPLTSRGASFGEPTPGRRSFELRTPDGTVTWVEGAPGTPPVLARAEELALRLERALC